DGSALTQQHAEIAVVHRDHLQLAPEEIVARGGSVDFKLDVKIDRIIGGQRDAVGIRQEALIADLTGWLGARGAQIQRGETERQQHREEQVVLHNRHCVLRVLSSGTMMIHGGVSVEIGLMRLMAKVPATVFVRWKWLMPVIIMVSP